MRTLTGLLCSLLLASNAYSAGWISSLNQNHPMTGKIYDLENLQEISSENLFSVLRQAPAVLVGEKHDNPDHHEIESVILDEVLSKSSQQAVVMEMLDDSQTSALSALTGQEESPDIKSALAWNDQSWPWEYYGPLIKQSLNSGATVEPGNLPRSQIREIYRKGSDTLEMDKRLKTALLVTDGVREQLLDEVYVEHCKMMPRSNLSPMVDIQLARDARMADAIETSESDQVVLIAGSYHVRKSLGVPMHLRLRESNLDPVVIMIREVDASSLDILASLNQLQPDADYVWFTPRFTDRDYCEDLAKHKK